MCGIAGVIDLHQQPDSSVMESASNMMIHRGPDEQGLFYEESICLIHRRLSIIDISNGVQPMFNEDKALVIVFNGEIYNFIELRNQLISKGHIFVTKSDTEVLLHGYEEWGKECVKKISGMFAFAIYNRKTKVLFLARDRCGEKPLYYYHHGGKFIFSSELKSLLAILGSNPSPDENAVYSYLRFGYIPAPYSYFQGVYKLIPGSYLLLQNDRLTSEFYYKGQYLQNNSSRNEISEDALCNELDTLLSNAVKKMLIADVPLGAFLSGGLDSSLVVAMMAKNGHRPKTFSISFEQASYDESSFAKKVSQLIGTDHTDFKVEFGTLEEVMSIMKGFDEPFADSSGIPYYYLSRETKNRVTVALSGDGSDELFGGYRRHLAQHFAEYYLRVPSFIRKGLIERVLSILPDRDVYYADSIIKSFRIFSQRTEAADIIRPGLLLNTIFSHNEVLTLFPNLPDGREPIESVMGTDCIKNLVESLIASDINLYLPNDILVKVDRMSMKNSLEVRAPFLDPDVIDFSYRIPISMKIKGINQKYLLKKVALKYLPPEIVFRKKHGFMIPLAKGLKQIGKNRIKMAMPQKVREKGIDLILETHFDKGIDCSHKIFALMVLGQYKF
jgi:asparagine synthase (glutamine-hydrolysing)